MNVINSILFEWLSIIGDSHVSVIKTCQLLFIVLWFYPPDTSRIIRTGQYTQHITALSKLGHQNSSLSSTVRHISLAVRQYTPESFLLPPQCSMHARTHGKKIANRSTSLSKKQDSSKDCSAPSFPEIKKPDNPGEREKTTTQECQKQGL